jgi:hypothetical protein
MTARRRRARLAALLTTLALGACGVKGTPVAPERRVPQAVSDLGGVVRDGGIDLSWSLPTRRVDRSRLLNPATARIFRVEDTGEGEPRPALLANRRIAGYTEIGTIAIDPASPARGNRLSYVDRQMLTPGRRYTYVVLTTDADGHTSPPSRRLSLTFLAAPEPPTGLQAEPGDRQVKLSWRPSARFTDGSAVTSPLVYEILRAPAADAPFALVARTPPDATSAIDRGVDNDRTYHYAVRAIRQDGETVAEGEPTTSVAVMPVDVTPPAAPTNLVAILSQGTVRLSWTPSPDADVARYVVYRAAGTGRFLRVGAVPAPSATFTDRTVRSGTYRYAVAAQDTSARANESPLSNQVTVTVP